MKEVDDLSRYESNHDPKFDPNHGTKHDPKHDSQPKPEDGNVPEVNPKKGEKSRCGAREKRK